MWLRAEKVRRPAVGSPRNLLPICRMCQWRVHLRPSPVDAVDLVLAGTDDDLLLSSRRRVEVGVQDRLPIVIGEREEVAGEVADRTLAEIVKAGLGADAVDAGEINVVFERPHPADESGVAVRRVGPVRRQADEVGPEEGENAGSFGEAAVEADADADLKAGKVVDGERPVAGVKKLVGTDARE